MFNHPATDFTCRRCGITIPHGKEETCWVCGGPLCYVCWDAAGECGHPEVNKHAPRQGHHGEHKSKPGHR